MKSLLWDRQITDCKSATSGITDELYDSWKKAVSNRFGDNYFNAPQRKFAVSNYKGMTNKGKIRLKSIAQYGLTMFWKEVTINKPKS